MQENDMIPPIYKATPHLNQLRGVKGSQNEKQNQKKKQSLKGQVEQQGEVAWDFDSKEHAREKYGNFNTPIVMKLVSKYNK